MTIYKYNFLMCFIQGFMKMLSLNLFQYSREPQTHYVQNTVMFFNKQNY